MPKDTVLIPEDDDDDWELEPIFTGVLVIEWHIKELEEFVRRANDILPGANGAPQPPRWMKTLPPHITTATLTTDIIQYIARNASEHFGNTVPSYFSVTSDLTFSVEADPFMQAAMAGAELTDRLATMCLVQKLPKHKVLALKVAFKAHNCLYTDPDKLQLFA